jgi:alpha-glucosidase (family GH31 glycosyl hydrolase)
MIDSQFMWGDSFLVAPKIKKPDEVLIQMRMQSVDYYLPKSEKWYNYDTKLVDDKTGVMNNVLLYDQEQAVFVKGGSIVPILLHDDCMSLLSCINNPLRLEVYPDGYGNAQG